MCTGQRPAPRGKQCHQAHVSLLTLQKRRLEVYSILILFHMEEHVCAEQMITQEHDHVENSVIFCPTRVFIRYTAEALMEARVKFRAALDFTHHLLLGQKL